MSNCKVGKSSCEIIILRINISFCSFSGPHKVNETNLLANLSSSLDESGSLSIPSGTSRTNSRLLSSFFRDTMRQNRIYQNSAKSSSNKDLRVATATHLEQGSSTESFTDLPVNDETEKIVNFISSFV